MKSLSRDAATHPHSPEHTEQQRQAVQRQTCPSVHDSSRQILTSTLSDSYIPDLKNFNRIKTTRFKMYQEYPESSCCEYRRE